MNDSACRELKRNYQELLEENRRLKSKIRELEDKLKDKTADGHSQLEQPISSFGADKKRSGPIVENRKGKTKTECDDLIDQRSDYRKKIGLFMSLFKGRRDVYAKRWVNKKGGAGYSPVCFNEWKPGFCRKPKVKCSKCDHKFYSQLDETVIENHLRGRVVVGVYPMNLDETCHFLAMDFDKEGWQNDVAAVKSTCDAFKIPIAVEISRSGNGSHAWFFFENAITALEARRFGTALLTKTMETRHELPFKSYDRLFPNQDTMPDGGLGNLIALPLQMSPRKNGNSVFVDENFQPYEDQWMFLSQIQRLSEDVVNRVVKTLGKGNELGVLKCNDSEDNKPWTEKNKTIKLKKRDFPKRVDIVKAGMLYITKEGMSQKVLNRLKRFAAFKNPVFYKNQAMRKPTYEISRIISCSEDYSDYLALPRGCELDVVEFLKEYRIDSTLIEKRNPGRKINVEFNGELRTEQQEALNALVKHDDGVLSATTAFGKTVVGAGLIGHRKVNTLILVHRQQLLRQWKDRLAQFLFINEKLPELPKKRGRKREVSLIGHLGGGKDKLTSIIDIAIMQSLNSAGDVKECIRNYGMIIVDECHHISAVSFEQILKRATAKYVYGLTATPSRRDGHHPIIFFHCGPVRFTVDAKKQAEERPFDHYLIPRFTNFRAGPDDDGNPLTIQTIYSRIIEDDFRNQAIVDDVVECHKNGRTSLVITNRIAHVKVLGEELIRHISDVILLTGGMGTKKTLETLKSIESMAAGRNFVLVATGSFIGEGFDEPRLDTLFLAMPISWKGTLQQYVGRLHRLHEGKRDVQVYDYVDIHVKMLESMYCKRLKGYASIGYQAKADSVADSPTEIIFNKQSFFPVYWNDVANARENILIVSPFVTKKRVLQMMDLFKEKIAGRIRVSILTRPGEEFDERKRLKLEEVFTILRDSGVDLLLRSNIHQKFAIIDRKTVWFGSINLLSFGFSEESIMRLVSRSIALELSRSVAS